MPSLIEDLYREIILDHHQNPRNQGELPHPDIEVEGVNPLCGDELKLTLAVNNARITDIKQKAHGCSISRASASILTEALKGRTLEEAEEIADLFKEMMLGQGEPDFPEELEDLLVFEGVRKYPVRIKCALLAWNTFLEGLAEFRSRERR